ncbi:MFS transporter [Parvibaculum sp.]|uniref:AmpG family muropeptide MFS transporter n=1 Tax=Parvibaculum sp. TaxID=2024848 RepID=UPI0025F2A570|nr:MFS transporter [Parvibaculum sp.]
MSVAESRRDGRMSLAEMWKVYAEPRMLIMLLLGFSAGLPYLLVFSTLSAWLREVGVTRTEIGLLSYVGLAYTIKFLWAPLLDRIRLPVLDRLLGKRRAWMIFAQAVAAAALVVISFSDPAVSLVPVVFGALVLAFASATQDISIDAWRIEAAPEEKQGAMAAVYQLGYRFALIGSGAGALYIAHFISWQAAYLAMAALMLVGIGAALLAPRLPEAQAPIIGEEAMAEIAHRFHMQGPFEAAFAWTYRAVIAPFVDFFGRYGWWSLAMLALIGLYRVPDFVMGVMANPLYIDIGFSLSTIATVVKVYGVWMTIAGAVVGGLAVARFGIMRTLLAGALAATLTNLVFVWLAMQGANTTALAITISAENFSGGFAGTCLIAYMSSLVNHQFAATQYALFSSAFALPGKILGGLSGVMVDWYAVRPAIAEALVGVAPGLTPATVGYVPFFISTALMGVPAILLILLVMGHRKKIEAKTTA